MAKIGTLNLVSRVTRRPIIKILMSITTTRWNQAAKKDFMKKYQKLVEIFSKNHENHGFLVYPPQIMVMWQAHRADKLTKIILIFSQEDFGSTSKKIISISCPVFFTNFLRLGGLYHLPGLEVNFLKNLRFYCLYAILTNPGCLLQELRSYMKLVLSSRGQLGAAPPLSYDKTNFASLSVAILSTESGHTGAYQERYLST